MAALWRRAISGMSKRYLSTREADSFNGEKEEKEKEMKKNLMNYLGEESPLKEPGMSEWATTPYPVGSAVETSPRPAVDAALTSIIMFPGQGNQFVGMCQPLMSNPTVINMFETASGILGYDLKKLCLEGPEAKLNRTEYCQPAMLVSSLAAVEHLKVLYPSALGRCVGTCGFSVGEMAALVLAGCLPFEKAVHLTRVRAEAMQKCSEETAGGMLTILCSHKSLSREAMEEAKTHCRENGIENPICRIASYLFPGCRVLAGHEKAIEYIRENTKKYRILKASRLKVSGAFHTELMDEAAAKFQKSIEKVHFGEPLVPVWSNVTGKAYSNARHIKKLLPSQICRPVLWEQTLQRVYQRPKELAMPQTYECGPGKSLSAILSQVNAVARRSCHLVSV